MILSGKACNISCLYFEFPLKHVSYSGHSPRTDYIIEFIFVFNFHAAVRKINSTKPFFVGYRHGVITQDIFHYNKPIVVYFEMDEDALRGLDPRANPQLQNRVNFR